MFKLIGKQQKISDILINKFNQPHNNIINDSLFLSGEMGTGKTYMGSYINSILFKKDAINVVVAPTNMIKKWIKILKEANPDIPIQKYTQSTSINVGYTYVMSYITFTKFINTCDLLKLNMVIIDEIQKCKYKMIENINNVKQKNKLTKFLFLTGTIFDSSTDILFLLLKNTHKELFNNYTASYTIDQNIIDHRITEFNLIKFINYIWKYISVSISLDDLKNEDEIDNDANLIQEIAPIKLIDMTPEEKSYYNLITHQAKSMGLSSKAAAKLASNYLDFPAKDLIVTKKMKVGRYISKKLKYQIGITLTDINLKNTNKYKQLLSILKDKKQTLIYITDNDLGKELVNSLREDNISTQLILNRKDTDEKINNAFKENQVVITNPKLISVGVDIEAEYLIWYQLLNNVTDILQAQRRITRLNSKLNSKVFLLGYNETQQQKIINEISNGAKNNAAAYGFKDKSNLAKVTGILLKGID